MAYDYVFGGLLLGREYGADGAATKRHVGNVGCRPGSLCLLGHDDSRRLDARSSHDKAAVVSTAKRSSVRAPFFVKIFTSAKVSYTVHMNTQFIKAAFGWGFALWLAGYVLGIVFFMFVPTSMIGWAITPIGVAMTMWVLWYKTHGEDMRYYVSLAIVWTLIAIVCDYIFLVLLFKPADGYYKIDVYLYYTLTFALPLMIGLYKRLSSKM